MGSARFEFGDFELDPAACQLRHRGRPVDLERIPMDLLVLLVERHDRVVTREEIFEKLWGKDVFLDADSGINTAVRKLRRTFHDNPKRSKFIKTFTGKGYRFIAHVTVPPGEQVTSKSNLMDAGERVMLAVLPFKNLSGDPSQDYFSDGLTEETISCLGRLDPRRLGIIARTSSMAYKHTHKSIARIGRELGVEYLLESSVRRDGTRTRTTAQLIRSRDQTHVWAASFDRWDASDLNIQTEIGKAIAAQVQINLEARAGTLFRLQTHDAIAYDLYLRGRYYWNQLTPAGIRRGIEYFQQAVASDTEYAQAYAGLAECWAVLPITSDVPAEETAGEAAKAARHAVELDDCLAEGHSAMGAAALWLEWDWPCAETALRRAIERNPSYVTAHRWYAHLLSNRGRHKEAAVEMAIARRLDPLSAIIHGLSGNLRYQAREYDKALVHLDRALALNSDLWVLHVWRSKVYERQGNLEAATKACQTAFDLSGGSTEPISLKGYIQARSGNRAEAAQTIALLAKLSEQRYVPPWNIAMVHAGLGEIDRALDWLERACETRDVRMTFLGVEPKWDFIRGHSRFQNLLERLSLSNLSNAPSVAEANWETEEPA